MYSFAGMAEYAVVPNTAVFPLPDALVDAGLYAESCVLGCAFFTAYGALRNAAGLDVVSGPAGASKGKSACVIGCGGVGGSVLQLLKYAGLSPIIAVDVATTPSQATAAARPRGRSSRVMRSRRSPSSPAGRRSLLLRGDRAQADLRAGGYGRARRRAACFIGISDVRQGRSPSRNPPAHLLVGSGARADGSSAARECGTGGIDLKGGVTRRSRSRTPAAPIAPLRAQDRRPRHRHLRVSDGDRGVSICIGVGEVLV